MTKKLLPFIVFPALVTTFILANTVSNVDAGEPVCLDVDPSYIQYGVPSIDITITGNNTHFDNTTTVDFGCVSVTEGAVIINSPTELTISITVPATGGDETCVATVTTGEEMVTCANDLYLPCVDSDNDSYCDVEQCDQQDPNINPASGENSCHDGIDNDCDGEVDCDDDDCSSELTCCPLTISPSSVSKVNLPRLYMLRVTGDEAMGFNPRDTITSYAPVSLGLRILLQFALGDTRFLVVLIDNEEEGLISLFSGNSCAGVLIVE
ncbi:MAG: hypothetical protein GY868_16945 [Deltaproteobacteria bacterium]|nr:hypothetical protein [Deltaproteobacteria bacterium]